MIYGKVGVPLRAFYRVHSFDECGENPQTLRDMVTALDLPQDLVENLQQRAAQEGRGIDETAAELLRAALAVSSRATAVRATPEMLVERSKIAEKFVSGEWGTELRGFEEGRAADRKAAHDRNETWRR